MYHYLTHLKAGGQSPRTVELRAHHLRRFEAFIGKRDIDQATCEDLERFLAAAGSKREYKRSLRSTLRGYYAYLQATGRRNDNPALLLMKIKPAAPKPHPTPDLAYQAALRDATDWERLALRLAAEQGMRRAEVACVHENDLMEDLTGWSILVHGKGGKERVLPLKDGLDRELRAHLAKIGGGYAFPGRHHGHLSAAYIGKRISRLLPAGYSMHSLRHRFATNLHNSTGDLLLTQLALGHASPETTQRYVLPPKDRVRAAINAA